MVYKHVIRAKTRNLFDISNADITQHSGYWTSNVDFTEHFYTQIVEPGKTYTVSYECYNPAGGEDSLSLSVQTGSGFYDGTRLYTGLLTKGKYNWVKFRGVFTIPNGITQVTFSAFLLTMFRNFQLEEGSTPTPYAPYNYLSSNKRMIKVSDVCQLVPTSDKADYTYEGVTFTNNHNGSWTISGTSSKTCWYTLFSNISLKSGHIYLNAFTRVGEGNDYVETKWRDKDGTIHRGDNPYTADENSNCDVTLIRIGAVTNTVKLYPQLFDLTEMFGAGHEPATVAEFRQRFPNELYPYSPQCWLTSYKSAVVCKTKNLFDYKTSAKKLKLIMV